MNISICHLRCPHLLATLDMGQLTQRDVSPPLIVTSCFSETHPKLIVKQGFRRPFPKPIPASRPGAGQDLRRAHARTGHSARFLGGSSALGRPPGSRHARTRLRPHWRVTQRLAVPACPSGFSGCRARVRSRKTLLCGCAYIYPPLVSPILKYLEPTTFSTWLL